MTHDLLSARVLHSGGGMVDVELWGREIRLAGDGSGAATGRVALVLRPESVGIAAEGATVAEGDVVTPGVVRARTFLGEKVEYAIEVGGVLLQAVAYDPLRHGLFDVGARVRVSCEPESLRPLAGG